MKVLHFITSLDRSSGGVASYLNLLAKELGTFCDLHIITAETSEPLNIVHAKVYFIPLGLKSYFVFKKEYTGLLKKIKPNIIHINAIWQPQTYFAQRWAQQMGIPVILSPHGMLEPYILARNPLKKKIALALYQQEAINRASIIHATAESEAENLRKFGIKQDIVIVPNAIETEGISCKDRWNKVQKLLFLSRIHPKKGIEFLLKALHQLKQEGIVLQLQIAGEGEETYTNGLKQLVNSLEIEDQVSFLGGVYGDTKWSLFKEADLFVLPTYSENFGIVVGEALYCGTPVITTKGTPWKELETEGCGWWIELKVPELVVALKSACSKSENEIMQMGKKGNQLVLKNYTTTMVASQMFSFYQKLVNK